MYNIKVTTMSPELPLVRQTPGWKGLWGNCRFHVDSPMEKCDFWIVQEGLKKREKVIYRIGLKKKMFLKKKSCY